MPLSQKVLCEPTWPAQRDLERYESLLGVSISKVLSGGGTWIDIGPGSTALPMMPFLNRPGISLSSIGAHARELSPYIEFKLGQVPDDVSYLNKYRGKARLVTDVYSSISYSSDPYKALLYCALLLEPQGICCAFTELKRFGDLASWDRGVQFFRSELKASLALSAISIFEDASNSFATALRVQVRREGMVDSDFESLCKALRRQVGEPAEVSVIWEAKDKSAVIKEIYYTVTTSRERT